MSEVRISTGVQGLDMMLQGGLIPGRVYLVKGAPGTGKTTLAMHFAMAGVARGEKVMYVSLEEPVENLKQDMSKLGFNLSDPNFILVDATPMTDTYVLMDSMFDSFAKGFNKMIETIKTQFLSLHFQRLVIDPLTMVKLSTGDEIEYRRLFLEFIKTMNRLRVTTLVTSELEKCDVEEYLVHGIIELKRFEREGRIVRGIRITKFRGSSFDDTLRPYTITSTGLVVNTEEVLRGF
ncbi:MAG: AAA family ATPase [Thermococcus sp.]|nr:AAA family ATPase [Thermococcus sp.]